MILDKKLRDFVSVRRIFDPNDYVDFEETVEDFPWVRHEWRGGKGKVTKENDGDVVSFENIHEEHPGCHLMMSQLRRLIGVNFAKELSESDCSRSGMPRLNRYRVGQRMEKHFDHIRATFMQSDDEEYRNQGIPILSHLVLLNDNFEGGEFMIGDEKVDLKAGDCVTWPSLFMYPHEVKAVTKGTRYSMVLWSW